MGSETLPKVPVIDFGKEDMKAGSSSWVSACMDVQNAFEEYGCFVAFYDKVSANLNNEVMVASEELFDLPTETKVRNVSEMTHFGYLGKKQLPDRLNFESLGIENATVMEGVQTFTNLMWPSGNDHFCETMHSYAKLVSELDQMVIRMIFQRYNVEKHYDSHIESTEYLLRFLKYGVSQMKEEETKLCNGAPPHTDRSLITILQQNEVNGLEVKSKDGEWFAVDLPPSSFIVMAGDALQAWSNDRVHAAVHRVKMSGDKARYTIALFSHINGIIQVPEELVDEEHPLRFKPFHNFGLLRFSLTKEAYQVESVVKAYGGISAANSVNN